tara:strand:+ start:87 stop:371 length:285 start_codon:yes stop_codon:yes gene_type:complete
MDRKTIEEIFKLGSDALYDTLNPDNGEVSDRYLELEEEAVKLFSIQLVSEPLQARRHITEKELMIASKQLKWRGSEIEYLIKKVRDNQTKSNAR